MANLKWMRMVLVLAGCFLPQMIVHAYRACPNPDCMCHDGFVDCSEQDFVSVPHFQRDNTTYDTLDLSYNRIKRLPAMGLQNISARELIITKNRRPLWIHPKALRGMEGSLEEVRFTNNKPIAEIPRGLFRNFTQLRYLFIFLSSVQTVEGRLFKNCINLELIDMGDNQITHLQANAFSGVPNLHTLDLFNNRIHMIDSRAFKGLGKLKRLDIKNNYIRDIQPKTFARLTSLQYLDLHNNKIPAIFPLMFIGLDSLKTLNMSKNSIIIVADDAFSMMTKLEVLILSKNKISFVVPAMFRGLESLKQLNILGNFIKDLPDAAFDHMANLESIQLDSNHLKWINPCAFHDIKKLTEIHVVGNLIQCDCRLKWSSEDKYPSVFGYCSSPESLKGQDIVKAEKYNVCHGDSGTTCKWQNELVDIAELTKQSYKGGTTNDKFFKYPYRLHF